MSSPQLQPIVLIGRDSPAYPSRDYEVDYNLQGLNFNTEPALPQIARNCSSRVLELTFRDFFEVDPRMVDRTDALQHGYPLGQALGELAIDVLDGYRNTIDFLTECGDERPEVLDTTIYQAAQLLAEAGEAFDLDLDRATAVVDRVSGSSYPHWPSRAIASLILMSYGLLLRGVGNFIDLFEPNVSPARFDPQTIYNLWEDVIGRETRSLLQIHCERANGAPFDTPNLTLRKAALLLSTLTDQELNTATAVIASFGPFNMPSDAIARAVLSRTRRLLSKELVYEESTLDIGIDSEDPTPGSILQSEMYTRQSLLLLFAEDSSSHQSQ